MKNSDHILWFFSTCAQTFAALVSVFGMFVLYRLQIEEGRIGALRERMVHLDDRHAKLPFDRVLQEMTVLEASHRQSQEHDHAQHVHTLLSDYEGATAKRASLSNRARQPVMALVLLTFWSLAGIILYPYYETSSVGLAIVWATLAISIFPLYQVAMIIAASLAL